MNGHFLRECYGRSYNTRLDGRPCEVVLGIGQAVHEIYQNKVFISSRYNLFSYGNTGEYTGSRT